MPSNKITVPNDKGSQKFTIGEIARVILETHESSPSIDAQVVIGEILKQAEGGKLPVSFRHGLKPDEENVFLSAAGHPYKSAASATRAARTRTDLQEIDWEIVSVDGGWGIREISAYANWFEYWANKETMTADELGYMVLVSTADMTRFCRSTAYQEWASPLGLGVPVMLGGEGVPLAKGQEDAPAHTLPPHDEPDPQTDAENVVPQYEAKEGEQDAPKAHDAQPSTPAKADQAQTKNKLKDWFVNDYVPAHKDDSPNPTREAALSAARPIFNNYVDQTHLRGDLRDIWGTHAPKVWKKRGPRAKTE